MNGSKIMPCEVGSLVLHVLAPFAKSRPFASATRPRAAVTSLHHAADWLAAHGVRVSASTLYAMYYRHRWEGTERATGRKITPLPTHVQVCSTSDMVHLNRLM